MAETEEEAHLVALRRRLYAPGATDADRRRYLAALDAAARESPPPPTGPPAPRRPLRAVGTAALAVVVVGGVVLAFVPRPAAPVAATAAPRSLVQDVGSGTVVGTSAPDDSAPGTLGLSVDGVATVAHRFRGTGSTVVELDTSAAPTRGGRLYVVLRSTGAAPISWQAVRPASAANGASFEQVIAMSDPGAASSGTPTTSTYDDDPPTRIVVAQTGSRPWTLTVAFMPRTMPRLE